MIIIKYPRSKTLETDKLILRELTDNDAYKTFKNWCNSDVVDQYVL